MMTTVPVVLEVTVLVVLEVLPVRRAASRHFPVH
jgi:hypothetical protein